MKKIILASACILALTAGTALAQYRRALPGDPGCRRLRGQDRGACRRSRRHPRRSLAACRVPQPRGASVPADRAKSWVPWSSSLRVLRELKSSGLIRTERGAFHLLDRDRLEQLGQFDPTYLHASPSV